MRRTVLAGVSAAALALLAACAPFPGGIPPPPGPGDSIPAPSGPASGGDADETGPIDQRVVYVIHGDGDYLYHDSAGRPLRADREAFRQAVEVAERASRAEVFIFHQDPATTRMFWAVPGGTFSHYRSGKLLRRQRYSTASNPRDFAVEAGLFQAHADDFAQPRRVFAYFGHEIPPRDRPGYSASRPEAVFSVARFAQGLSLWARPTDGSAKPFDLVVLSTCYGGTPAMMELLAPLADYAVASPAYLHLSHLDTRALAVYPASADVPPDSSGSSPREEARRLADTVAAQSFERLKGKTQTEITVAVYDLEQVAPFTREQARAAPPPEGAGASGWRDCAADPGFDAGGAARGVTLHYRPPRFGPGKDVAARSGWQCPR